jgi:hypothetical protein
VSDKRALASAPLDNGVVTWDGELPAVLLVLPPSGSRTVNNRTLYFGSLGDIENLLLRSTLIVIPGEPENQLSRPTESGSGDSENQLSRPTESGSLGGAEDVYVRRLEELAALAPQVAVALGAETAPTSIVAVPYLDEIVWSGDLLLVGDGTSFVSEENGDVLFHSDSAELDATIQERTLMAALSRAWLDDHMVIATGWLRVRPDQLGVIAYTGMPGETDIVWLPGVADHPQGRWIRSQGPIADLAPVLSSPEGRQQLLVGGGEDQRRMPSMADIQRLGVEEQLDLVALWLAVELADSAAREADLAVLLAPPDPSPSSDKFEPFLLRLLPFDFPVGQAQKAALIWALHDWLEEAGREQALRLVGEAVREQSDAFNLESLLAELEQRSGVAIEYEESE